MRVQQVCPSLVADAIEDFRGTCEIGEHQRAERSPRTDSTSPTSQVFLDVVDHVARRQHHGQRIAGIGEPHFELGNREANHLTASIFRNG